MGCCQSQNNIKQPKNTQQPIKNIQLNNDTLQASSLKSASRPLNKSLINEKQRIDTPMITEENIQNNRDPSQIVRSGLKAGGDQNNLQYFDISPKIAKKNKIYRITNKIPKNKVYSNPSEWQKIFKNYQQISEEQLVKKILSIRQRNWIKEQIKHQIELSDQNVGSLESLVMNRRFLQMREHFNWLVWAVGQQYFQQKYDPSTELPKINSRIWNEGFEYKGVYFKVLPYEEAYYIHNEIKALRYVQTEIMELQSISSQIMQTYRDIKHNLVQDVILPLLSGISCGGFYLYGTPIIQTEELEHNKDFHRDTINNSKSGLGSIIQINNSLLNMQAIQEKSNLSYSYLHNNINPEFIQESTFKFMPILKNVQTSNMIPIIDFEEYHEKKNEDLIELKYLLVNLYAILPRLKENESSTVMMIFPCHINEDITFHPFPSTNYIEQQELNKLLSQDIQKDQEQKDINTLFIKKFFTKHGWDLILMSKQGQQIENKKATNLYNKRELNIKHDPYDANQNNMLFIDDYQVNEEHKEKNQQYISPQKQTILKRNDSVNEDIIKGNCIVACYNFRNDFKVKYSICNHTYSSNIETLYQASIEQVAKIIEQSDNIYNSKSLKELLHRKGLNIRFEWAVLTKLRINFYREIVMVDILLRVMRKIVNEEIKLKSKVQNTQVTEGGTTLFEEFYLGNQLDIYKETIIFYMNAILKRKFTKYKQVFDETLLGLFLSRNQILPIAFQLNLKKEEYIYLESKDILEDIIEVPSKNPVLFINAIQTYFNIDLKQEFLRICRQDKHILLSKGQPITAEDISNVQIKLNTYFTIREQAYFMLAKQITRHSKKDQPKIISRVKTKLEKDKIRQQFQKPRGNESMNQTQQSIRSIRDNGIGPLGIQNETSTFDQNDSKTVRNLENNHKNKESINTIRQYKNFDQNMEPSSPPLQESKTSRVGSSISNTKKFEIIDLSKLNRKSNFKPTSVQEIILPSNLYKLKTYLQKNAMYCFDQSSKTYIGETLTVFKSYYEMPDIDLVNEWVICIESLLKDVHSCNGDEQVLLEGLTLQSILIYFFENDHDSLFKVLTKIRDILFTAYKCSPETIMMIQIITGIFFEEHKEQHPLEAEKNYLAALICILQLYGDPRGRGNIGIPYTLFLSWKLSLLSLAEDKKVQDSEFAEELFDACLKSLFNHNKLYKEQQLEQIQSQQKNIQKQDSEKQSCLTQFEQEIEKQEIYRQIFDIKKYSIRSNNLTVASGRKNVRKGSNIEASQVYVSHNPNFQSQMSKSFVNQQKNFEISSKSQVVFDKNKKRQDTSRDYEIDVSDVDLEVQDENKHFFIEENFKNNEQYIGTCPFQHWSLYRQQIAQILQAHNNILTKNTSAAVQYQKQIYKDILQKGLPKDIFYQWLVKFNPIMHQQGIQWNNQMIMEMVFSQNQQMISSSGSSVAVSNQRLSQRSISTIANTGKERKHVHLGNYSQILGKELGGISKQDMRGVLFDWGTDASGQLGLDILTPSQTQFNANLKVLYPRMVVQLKDEIIKEICCGHSHTLVTNIHGQVFCWGLNESAQLGLGPNAPSVIKKPVLNPYLKNVIKLSAGNEHSLAITKNGDLYTWGGAGLTGSGERQNKIIPSVLEFFNKSKVQVAVCGGLHTIAVTKDGVAYSWGSTEGGQLGLPMELISKLCPNKEQPVLKPQKIQRLEGKHVLQVSCGEAHTIVLTQDNEIFGWGMSNYGQLGLGFSSDSFEPGIGMEKSKVYEPEQITALKHERIQKVYCGATFSLFQTEIGDLYGCGMNDLGQLGLDTFMEEMQLATLQKARKGMHQQTSDVTVPTKIICFQGIPLSNISCGENHALAVSGDEKNMLWSWGMYKNGQLGLGEVTMKMNPRPVQTLCSSQIQKIACGSLHSLALIGDTQQITTHSDQYYISNDVLANYWTCDIKGLCIKQYDDFDQVEEDVPDDKTYKVRNPK